ncbi:hypothetical protein [Polymorphospora rubra]
MAEKLEDLLEAMAAIEPQMDADTDEGGEIAWTIAYSTFRA